MKIVATDTTKVPYNYLIDFGETQSWVSSKEYLHYQRNISKGYIVDPRGKIILPDKNKESNVKISDYIASISMGGTTWTYHPSASPETDEILSTLSVAEKTILDLEERDKILHDHLDCLKAAHALKDEALAKWVEENKELRKECLGTCPKGHPLWRSQTNHQLLCTECKRADPEWTLEKAQKREKRKDRIATLLNGTFIFMLGWLCHHYTDFLLNVFALIY